MADFSYLLQKSHSLTPLSFVSRQRLDFRTALPFPKPRSRPAAEQSAGRAGSRLASALLSQKNTASNARV